jgi:hypothetical protein
MSGLALAHHIVDLKLRLIAHQRVLGAVKVALHQKKRGSLQVAKTALAPVQVSYDDHGPIGRLVEEGP